MRRFQDGPALCEFQRRIYIPKQRRYPRRALRPAPGILQRNPQSRGAPIHLAPRIPLLLQQTIPKTRQHNIQVLPRIRRDPSSVAGRIHIEELFGENDAEEQCDHLFIDHFTNRGGIVISWKTHGNCMGLEEDGHAVSGNGWDKTVDAPDVDSDREKVGKGSQGRLTFTTLT